MDSERATVPPAFQEEAWFKRWWRPLMAAQYMLVCLFDFLAAPIWIAFYYKAVGADFVPWVPLTLQGGGLYHMSMMAIVGVTAWTRGTEKVAEITELGRGIKRQHREHPDEPPLPRYRD